MADDLKKALLARKRAKQGQVYSLDPELEGVDQGEGQTGLYEPDWGGRAMSAIQGASLYSGDEIYGAQKGLRTGLAEMLRSGDLSAAWDAAGDGYETGRDAFNERYKEYYEANPYEDLGINVLSGLATGGLAIGGPKAIAQRAARMGPYAPLKNIARYGREGAVFGGTAGYMGGGVGEKLAPEEGSRAADDLGRLAPAIDGAAIGGALGVALGPMLSVFGSTGPNTRYDLQRRVAGKDRYGNFGVSTKATEYWLKSPMLKPENIPAVSLMTKPRTRLSQATEEYLFRGQDKDNPYFSLQDSIKRADRAKVPTRTGVTDDGDKVSAKFLFGTDEQAADAENIGDFIRSLSPNTMKPEGTELGAMTPSTGSIRVRPNQEKPLQTWTHEGGHALDFLGGLRWKLERDAVKSPALRDEFIKVSMNARPGHWFSAVGPDASDEAIGYVMMREELLADFISAYIVNPRGVKEMAPEASKWLRQTVNKSDLGKFVSFLSIGGLGAAVAPDLMEQHRQGDRTEQKEPAL